MATLPLPRETAAHERVRTKLVARLSLARQGQQKRHDAWRQAEERTLAYLPESEQDAQRRTKRDAGEPRYTTIQVPYSFALLMSAHTYWTSVFFARSPVHQYSGRHGEGEQQIQALEALIDYQVQVGAAMVPYYVWLYDAPKYGHGIIGHCWAEETLHYGQLIELDGALYQATSEIPGYCGNRVFNVSPWDFMHDPRVPLKDFQRGEFCCRRVRLGWPEILERRRSGYFNANVEFLERELTDKSSADSALERPEFTRSMDDGDKLSDKHPAGHVFEEVYVRLIPAEWGFGNYQMPQHWCLTITEDERLVVGASPLGYLHCQFPFDVIESEIEGYGLFARGLPEIMDPIQNTMDWLLNTHFFNVRAAINNQFIVDPSKLVIKDVQNSGPGFVWRLRPEAYGTDITKMFYQVPVNDVTARHMGDFQQMFGIGEKTLGINEQIMGSLNQSGRRTATEVRTSTGFGINRLKTAAEYASAMGFGPHSQKLVQTSQQFYTGEQKMRRVGSYALEAGARFLTVSPADIAGFFDFVPVDGTLPVDRMAQANLWKEIFAQFRMLPPQVAAGYDWGRMFAWAATLGGLKNINQFRVQVAPDAQLQTQAQVGNVVPMRPPGQSSPSASTVAGLNALPGQEGFPNAGV